MTQTDRDQTLVEEPFALTPDQYGRIGMHAKLDGIEVAIDLADKHLAFRIMASKLTECGFDHRSAQGHSVADNDDKPQL